MSSLFSVCPAPFQKPRKKGELNASMDRLRLDMSVLSLCMALYDSVYKVTLGG
jgi:hypothetical protein